MFWDAKVGDRVYSINFGWGTVKFITSGAYPLMCSFDCGAVGNYTLVGKHGTGDLNPTLFWDEVKFTVPTKPKRKVKRVIEGWVNFYHNNKVKGFDSYCGNPICATSSVFRLGHIWASEEEAKRRASEDVGPICPPVFIRHEYEVGE